VDLKANPNNKKKKQLNRNLNTLVQRLVPLMVALLPNNSHDLDQRLLKKDPDRGQALLPQKKGLDQVLLPKKDLDQALLSKKDQGQVLLSKKDLDQALPPKKGPDRGQVLLPQKKDLDLAHQPRVGQDLDQGLARFISQTIDQDQVRQKEKNDHVQGLSLALVQLLAQSQVHQKALQKAPQKVLQKVPQKRVLDQEVVQGHIIVTSNRTINL